MKCLVSINCRKECDSIKLRFTWDEQFCGHLEEEVEIENLQDSDFCSSKFNEVYDLFESKIGVKYNPRTCKIEIID